MFGFVPRPRRRSTSVRPQRVSLAVELLEGRDCPAGTGGPAVVSFSAAVVSATTVHLAGTVRDQNPAGCQVTISGEVNATATTDSNGNFTVDAQAAGLGTVTAQATDAADHTSAPLDASLGCDAPALTLTSSVGDDGVLTLSGQVTDLDGGGDVVTFDGAVSGTATTDAGGNFTFTTPNWALGDVTAATSDVWGQASNAPRPR